MPQGLNRNHGLPSASRTDGVTELVYLGLTPQGRGLQPSLSAGVEDFTLSRALARYNL